MSDSERTSLLLRVIDVSLSALGSLSPSPEALRFEREADALRATVESWRDTPPSVDTRKGVMERVLRLHSAATMHARQETTEESPALGAEGTSNDTQEDAGPPALDEGDRTTPVSPFNMEAFAWDMTSPDSEHRPRSDPPDEWRNLEGQAIDVEVDDAIASWSEAPAAPEDGQTEMDLSREPVTEVSQDDMAAPTLSHAEIEDPGAYVLERYRARDYASALDMANLVLSESPGNLLVRECRDRCREALTKQYIERLGSVARIPVVLNEDTHVPAEVDHRASFLLSLVDGLANVEQVVDASGMPPLDALRILSELLQRRVIGFG